MGFGMSCEPAVGALLRTLAASKPAGTLLELGTGAGVGTAWLLDGMSGDARLASVDNDPKVSAVARRLLGSDPRVTFHVEDAARFLGRLPEASHDLIFADAWPGKYSHLEAALRLLKPGGCYVVDDMLPLAEWAAEHREAAERLVLELSGRGDMTSSTLAWSGGVILAVKLA